MRNLAVFFILFFSLNLLSNIDYSKVYIINKHPLQILHLKESGEYELVKYNQINLDYLPLEVIETGKYKVGLFYIVFNSFNKKHSIMNGIKIYKKGILYENYLTDKKEYKTADTNTYHSFLSKPKIRPEKIDYHEMTLEGYARNYYTKTVHKYTPAYDHLIKNSYCGIGCYTTYDENQKKIDWNRDTSSLSLLYEFGTVIHESTHFNNEYTRFKNGYWCKKYLVDPEIEIEASLTGTFKSELFITMVPPIAPYKIFRYKLYIGVRSLVSSNIIGIYGLLDELSAYRNGLKSCIDGMKKALDLKDEKIYDIFYDEALGTYFAYYEFNLFISWYLQYAEKKYPQVYKNLMENTNLRVAYTLLEKLFKEDVEFINKTAKNYPTYKYDYIEERYVKYTNNLLKENESALDKFKLKNVDKNNWKTHINDLNDDISKNEKIKQVD
jgi:hypothetical protein